MTPVTSEYICTATFVAKPGMINQLIEQLAKLIPHTRQEAGCIRYEMHQDLENPDAIFFIEKFQDKTAFEMHLGMDYVRNFLDSHLPKLVENVQISTYKELLF